MCQMLLIYVLFGLYLCKLLYIYLPQSLVTFYKTIVLTVHFLLSGWLCPLPRLKLTEEHLQTESI